MMSSARSSSRFPFTASQWQELEHQALIFKYMVSGMPIPPDLLYTVRRSLDSSLSSKLLLHQPQLGWNCFQMGFGRKIDPEPGRCRRTDGKKWRCSKEAYPDSKYCERHMHRGRNRSRKPVEQQQQQQPLPTSLSTNINNTSSSTTANNPPTAIPIKTTNTFSPSSPTSHHSFSCLTSLGHSEPHFNNNPDHFLYSHSSSSQENATTNFLLDSGSYSHGGSKGYNSYGHGAKEEADHERAFFSEPSGAMRNMSGSSVDDSSWQLAPLTMGSPLGHMKQQQQRTAYSSGSNYLQLQSFNDNMMGSRTTAQKHQLYPMGMGMGMGGGCDDQNHHQEMGLMLERDEQPKKVMHHFFDEWPPKEKIQLSISMPNSSSQDLFLHDQKWYVILPLNNATVILKPP